MGEWPKMVECPKCGQETLEGSRHEKEFQVAGVTFKGAVPSETCTVCKEEYIYGLGLLALDLCAAMELISRGIRNGEAFKFCRKVCGMTDKEVAGLCGVRREDLPFLESSRFVLSETIWHLIIPRVRKKHDECLAKHVTAEIERIK
jgi:hypothetical protein